FPVAAPVAVGVILSAISFIDIRYTNDEFVTFLSGITVAFMFGMLKDRTQALAGMVFLTGTVAVIAHNQGDHPGDFGFPLIVFAIAWVVGFVLGQKFLEGDLAKERAERLEREREEQARLAVAEERARIARELHDIVGHSVSVMTVQAAGVRSLLRPDQE